MADVTRRTQRKVVDYLDEGETIEVAVLCEPRGTYGAGMFAIAVAPRTGETVLRRQADAVGTQVGIGSKFPTGSCVVAVSARRVYVFPSNGLRYADPTVVVERCDVKVGQVARRGLGRGLQLVFIDGSAVDVDTQLGQPVKKLAETLGKVAPIS
jgi:hypothetical protein